MKTFTLQEACIALTVEATTLYRWMERAGIEAETDEADKRRRTLTQAQVQQLARAHHRQLPRSLKPETLDQEAMQQRIETLESRIEELERKVERLASAPTPRLLRPPRAEYTTEAPAPGGNLPAGYVPLVDLMRQYNVPETTMRRHMQPYFKRGNWKANDGRTIKLALDQAGIAEFMRQFVTQATAPRKLPNGSARQANL